MASQQDIKQRITSITGTSKITRAMELVASAKLRRAQVRIEALRPYAKGMRRLMSGAARRSGSLNGIPLLEEREETRRASVIAVTGDRGLAGAFNVNVIRRSLQEADDLIEQGFDEVVFTAVGKKGGGTLRFRGKVLGLDGEHVKLATEAGEARLPFADIDTAKLVLTDELIAASLKQSKQ